MYYSFETIIKYCGIYSWFNKFLFSDKKNDTFKQNCYCHMKYKNFNKILYFIWFSYKKEIHIPTPFGCKNIVNYFKYLERFYNSFLYS